jgi:hypothetical protein
VTVRPRRRRVVVVLLAAVSVVALGACGSDAKVVETKDGKVTVDGSGDKAKVTVEGENGNTITFNEQQVPSDFPGAVPLPQKVQLRGATSGTRGDKEYFQLSYALDNASARATVGAYATRLGDAGFSVDQTDTPGNDAIPSPMQADGKGWHVLAIANGAGSGSMIVTVTPA